MGLKSSLKMLPAYIDRPTGKEKGEFIALDLGGTNLRVLQAALKGQGRIVKLREKVFILEKRHTGTSAAALFDFIAGCIKNFLKEGKAAGRGKFNLGFTFSFPVRPTGRASGTLLHWTKDFRAKDALGKDVVKLLNQSFERKGINNIRITALANDTVGTLVCRSYTDPHCDVGVILGTGTNACYRDKTKRMLVNIEWGNFDKLNKTVYDKLLDRDTDNPGEQILEKMVSGMYLGELSRLIIRDSIKRKMLFGGLNPAVFQKKNNFKTEYMSRAEEDRSADLAGIASLLKELGILKSGFKDRALLKKICGCVSKRASSLSAIALAAVISKIDPRLSRKHTVAIDGSVYEKHPGFSKNMRATLRQLFAEKSRKIKMALTKDGSGAGAAIIAAIALKKQDNRGSLCVK